jgi:hypothetical protein
MLVRRDIIDSKRNRLTAAHREIWREYASSSQSRPVRGKNRITDVTPFDKVNISSSRAHDGQMLRNDGFGLGLGKTNNKTSVAEAVFLVKVRPWR